MNELNSTLKEAPPNEPIFLDNETCPYCGTELNAQTVTKEHVIGRNFVPKGKLEAQWNLIVRACRRCNFEKSQLEDDLSAISMHPDAWGRHAVEDEVLASEAARKAKNCGSRRTGKIVKDSMEEITLSGSLLPGVNMTINLVCAPQADSERVYSLSSFHLRAFFYFVTYNQASRRGGIWLGDFFPILEARRADWGNAIHRAFMEAVVSWEPRFLGFTARGFFKVVIRRHPTAVCWSWALEWNENYRIIGFLGEQDPTEEILRQFPNLQTHSMVETPHTRVRYRREVALSPEDDKMFHW